MPGFGSRVHVGRVGLEGEASSEMIDGGGWGGEFTEHAHKLSGCKSRGTYWVSGVTRLRPQGEYEGQHAWRSVLQQQTCGDGERPAAVGEIVDEQNRAIQGSQL